MMDRKILRAMPGPELETIDWNRFGRIYKR
jgi:hypothetical protein